MAFLFRPPVRILDGARHPTIPNPKTDFDDGGRRGNLLMRHFRREGPATAVIIDGTLVREKQSPTTTELNAATYHYLGGHEYTVSATEKALLESAGYTVLTI